MPTESKLHRLNDTLWSYIPSHEERIPPDEFEEIRLSVPTLENGRERFELVKAIQTTFEANRDRLKRDFFRKGFRVVINDLGSPLAGTWDVGFERKACLSRRIVDQGTKSVAQFFPFCRTLTKRNMAVISVHQAKECAPSRMLLAAQRIITLQAPPWSQPAILTLRLPGTEPPEETILKESFQDSFTTLASKALKTICPYFVLEAEHRDGYRFVLNRANELFLEPISQIDKEVEGAYKAENRTVVRAYKDFLVREFGQDIVDYIGLEYGIDFEEMIENGEPLCPDHVAKCNIGANNVEMRHVEVLWSQLIHLSQVVQAHQNPGESAASFLIGEGRGLIPPLPLRVLRKILGLVSQKEKEPTVATLRALMHAIMGESPDPSVRTLPMTAFDAVVSMIMPSDDERKRSFTGRRIRHLAVMGYNTMGDPNIPCHCRDLFELLHIFKDLRKEGWKNFFELLSHVVSKKSVYRQNREPDASTNQTVRAGLIIPGPDTKEGTHRWYYVDGFYDDSKGNVNYVLVPACKKDIGEAPMVKLYRSTASNRNAENSYDSIMADLNPRGPGSLRPDLSLRYERDHFIKRTIPIWMGYLLAARTENLGDRQPKESPRVAKRIEILKKSFEAFKEYMKKLHPTESLDAITAMREQEKFEELEDALNTYGRRYREDPRYKIHQNVACVGHSLGGVLAQQGTYYFSAKDERMPLPAHQFICYSSDGPAMTNDQDREFMRFGRTHHKMFRELNVKWQINHQFEAGDIVPESGGSHIGTTGYLREKDDWLEESIGVFSPLEKAKALSIVTPSTHGRRIGTALATKDYAFTKVTPHDLANYDHSYFLSKKLRNIWKYRVLNSPKLAERVRSTVGLLLQKLGILHILDNIGGEGIGVRDAEGVLAVRYAPIATGRAVV